MDKGLNKHYVSIKFQFWSLYYGQEILKCLGGQGALWIYFCQICQGYQ